MELRRLFEVLNRRKWIVAVTTLATLAVAVFGTLRTTPTYSAAALVRVAQANPGAVTYSDINYSERLIQTYVLLLKSRPLLEEVVSRLDLALSPYEVGGMVAAESVPNTELIRIGAESADPELAAAVANELAAVLVEQGQALYSGQGKSAREILLEQITILEEQLRSDRDLLAAMVVASDTTSGPSVEDLTTKIGAEEQTYSTLLSQYESARLEEALRANSLTVVEPAIVPQSPSKPRVQLNLMLGLAVGIVGGMGLGLIFENLDPVLHDREDVESLTNLPILGTIPQVRAEGSVRKNAFILKESTGRSPVGEAFRMLGTKTMAVSADSGAKTFLVTSPGPQAGKSTVVANLAKALAQAGHRVIVVDGDLHRPVVHSLLGVTKEPGLSDVVAGTATLSSTLKDTRVAGVRALTAGSAPAHPMELLGALAGGQLLKKLAECAEFVIWDSPPVLATADAAVLAPLADGVLLVVPNEQATAKQVHLALRELNQVGAETIGIVYNKARADGSSYSYYGYYDSPARGSRR